MAGAKEEGGPCAAGAKLASDCRTLCKLLVIQHHCLPVLGSQDWLPADIGRRAMEQPRPARSDQGLERHEGMAPRNSSDPRRSTRRDRMSGCRAWPAV